MSQRRVLVTGGAGFIGAAVTARFAAAGYAVRVLDDLSTGSRERCAPEVELRVGDVADAPAVAAAVADCDVVVHLAALVSVPESFARREECERVNVEGTRVVTAACGAHGVPRLVFASSCAVYAGGDAKPLREDDPPGPGSPYAASKLAGEALVTAAEVGGIALRLFNVYGPGQPADSAYAAAVPSFARAALRGEPLTVYGDGRQSRDFVYVDDVADAFFAASHARVSGVFNVGTGEPLEIEALARRIAEVAGQGAQLRHTEPRAGDVRAATADVTRVREALDWEPRTSLERGLEQTLAWWRERHAVPA